MRRRALFILASMMLGVLLLGGVALAKEITGTSGSDDLEGTNRPTRFGGSEARTISPVSKAAMTSTLTLLATKVGRFSFLRGLHFMSKRLTSSARLRLRKASSEQKR